MKKIGITLGDQAGIGPEISAAALAALPVQERERYVLIGEKLDVPLGQPTVATAKAAFQALEKSVEMLQSGEIHAVVTAPVAKEYLHEVGFHYPGQTEFYADRLGCENYAMCLSGARLTVVLVTIHIPLAKVAGSLETAEIVRIGKLTEAVCRRRGHSKPRIAVCGLNPHAGENGAFGSEEAEIICPAIEQLDQGRGIFSGPHSADTLFGQAASGHYDAVLSMYHDQGLIPLKLLDFDTGVNTTLGLPFVRTSPDHGTAFDIAGKGKANHSSMLHAMQLAAELL